MKEEVFNLHTLTLPSSPCFMFYSLCVFTPPDVCATFHSCKNVMNEEERRERSREENPAAATRHAAFRHQAAAAPMGGDLEHLGGPPTHSSGAWLLGHSGPPLILSAPRRAVGPLVLLHWQPFCMQHTSTSWPMHLLAAGWGSCPAPPAIHQPRATQVMMLGASSSSCSTSCLQQTAPAGAPGVGTCRLSAGK